MAFKVFIYWFGEGGIFLGPKGMLGSMFRALSLDDLEEAST